MTRDELETKKDVLEQAYWKKLTKYIVVDFALLLMFVVSVLKTEGQVNKVLFFIGMAGSFTCQLVSYHILGREKRKLMDSYLALDEEYLISYADEVGSRERNKLDELRNHIKEEEKALIDRGLN